MADGYKAKKVKLGSVMVKTKDGRTSSFIALGQRNQNKPQYNYSVELTVKDSTGKVVAHQTDGFIEIVDPRTQAKDLLALGFINEEQASKMNERASKIPATIQRELWVKTTS
jgi:hypothetical protein